MQKSELIGKVAIEAKVSNADAERVINKAIEIVMYEVAKGEAVQLIGFGTFSLADKAEKIGRNPRTGEAITIPAHKSPLFKAGKTFKELANGGLE